MDNIIINGCSTNIDWTTIIISLLSACIAGFFSWLATIQAHKNNQELKDKEIKLYERSTVLSVVEELKVLKNLYQKYFDEDYENLNNDYIKNTYTITQDFTTVYTQNAGEIGLIKNFVLRNKIIKANILIKRYIEFLLQYKENLDNFEIDRTNFLQKYYPQYFENIENIYGLEELFTELKKNIKDGKWNELNIDENEKSKVANYMQSDDITKQHLIDYSKELINQYDYLKNEINEVVELADEEYKNK